MRNWTITSARDLKKDVKDQVGEHETFELGTGAIWRGCVGDFACGRDPRQPGDHGAGYRFDAPDHGA